MACMNADKNDPEKRRKIIVQEEEMMATGEMSLNRSKEMRSKIWMELSASLGSHIYSSCSLLDKGRAYAFIRK